ncbi:zinc metalloproteinase nas-8-like [Nylanderia fulva]|uniref:zinc metalloproteinase nas-8-like n=1 Tax=Nylanderia fulva TaxID=613905 RepID=UPI0010FAE65C|nr:zinc metalloproteinase nas-8-like [Nylanderia fulva]
MQKTRYALFSLTLVVLLDNLLIKDINARKDNKMIKVSNDTKICTEPLQTRRTSAGRLITYRLNKWSQYENPEEIAHKREGDINEVSSRKTLTRDVDLLWPNGVVRYFINDEIVNRSKELFVLMRALRIIAQNTCIKFDRILFHPKRMLNNWINITGTYQGCYCDIGRRPVGPTHMNLNVYQCFANVGHAIHEMMHALGVFHEHVRPDRDNYVTIIWENIKKSN